MPGEEIILECHEQAKCPSGNTCREHVLVLKSLEDLQRGAEERRHAINELRDDDANLNLKLLEAINELNGKIGENLVLINQQITDLRLRQQQDSTVIKEYIIVLLITIVGAIIVLLF